MLKDNKSFQFLVGLFILFLAYKCWASGVFDWFFQEETEGFESVSLLPMILTAIVSAVQLVGLVAIMIVSGLQPLAEQSVDYIRGMFPKGDTITTEVSNSIDSDKLVETLNKLDQRISNLEEVESKND